MSFENVSIYAPLLPLRTLLEFNLSFTSQDHHPEHKLPNSVTCSDATEGKESGFCYAQVAMTLGSTLSIVFSLLPSQALSDCAGCQHFPGSASTLQFLSCSGRTDMRVITVSQMRAHRCRTLRRVPSQIKGTHVRGQGALIIPRAQDSALNSTWHLVGTQ